MLSRIPKNTVAAHHRILCVDDDPRILEGLALTLGRWFQVELAPSGMAALEILRESGNTTVIISDMQMPSMNGAQFLAASRMIAPDARRILLTGHADTEAAILAVNQGGIFRFLTKPCPSATLLAAVEAAIADFDDDASERSAIRKTVTQDLRSHDSLTGLASREVLLEQLDRLKMDPDSGERRPQAVFVIDVSDVEDLSDGYESQNAQRLIQRLSRKLTDAIPGALCLARYREAIFVAVTVTSDPSDAALESFAAGIVGVLDSPVDLDGAMTQIRTTVGIARIPTEAGDPRRALRQAELAAREAKRCGNHPVRLSSPDSVIRNEKRRDTIQALRTAVTQQQFHLHYQPIIDIERQRVYSVEALARWKDARLGVISPAVFIPLAEETGLIVPLGEWVMNQACEDGRKFGLLVPSVRCVSVNVSLLQILDPRFMAGLYRAIETNSLDPSGLELELTETVFAEDLDRVCQLLSEAQRLGVRIAIDDFGAGYSSLAYLARLPVDILKIDGSFVREFDRGGEAIIGAAIAVARTLKIDVVVEGVETESQLARVRALGATKVQGFHFARPMPSEALVDWHEQFVKRYDAVTS